MKPPIGMTRGEFVKLGLATLGGVSTDGHRAWALQPTNGKIGQVMVAQNPADTILFNGKVATMDAVGSVRQAVAVRDGLIVDVGSDAAMRLLTGPETMMVDLGGRTLTPGFVDAHCHFQLMAIFGGFLLPLAPPEVTSIVEMKDAIADLVAGLPAGEWVKAYYVTVSEERYPDRHDFDAVAPNNPVYVMHQGGHWACVNSRALEIAGINRDTPNPPGGIVEKDEGGEPTGVLYNHRAMDLVRAYMPVYDSDDVEASILSTQPLFAAVGVTSFQDNNARLLDSIRTYQSLAVDSKMYLRQSLFYTLEWPQDLERALNEIDHVSNDFTHFAGFKFLIDGQGPTFYCHQPHDGASWDMPTWDPVTFKEHVRILHDTGLQICVHCGGDAAADLALDAFEEAMDANPRPDPRHRLEHAVLTTTEATQRMKDLGVIVSTQPQFIRFGGDGWASILSQAQLDRVMMTREWIDNGVKVALGSDTPTTAWYDPQATLYGALTRTTASGLLLGGDQVMTVDEALRAHTVDAAHAVFQDDVKGSVESGKYADLIVWSSDPYTITTEEIYRSAIDLTMVGGEIKYLGPRFPRRRVGG